MTLKVCIHRQCENEPGRGTLRAHILTERLDRDGKPIIDRGPDLLPATGYDSQGIQLCCGKCLTVHGCDCEFHARQKQVAAEIPISKGAVSTARPRKRHAV